MKTYELYEINPKNYFYFIFHANLNGNVKGEGEGEGEGFMAWSGRE